MPENVTDPRGPAEGIHHIKNNRRRARANGLPASLSYREWLWCTRQTSSQCLYCGMRPLEQMDHFLPLCLGGSTVVGNVVPACNVCGLKKGNRHPREWLSLLDEKPKSRVVNYLRSVDFRWRPRGWSQVLTWRP